MRNNIRKGFPSSDRRQDRKPHRTFSVVAAAALGAMTLASCSPSSALSPDTVGSSSTESDAVQRSLDALVSEDGLPAALASIQDRNGNSHNYTAGVGDLTTGSEVPPNGQIRIGSNTKTFTAVVVLQLVAEGKIELDTPIETYLPGLVRGDGIDGHNITIRQLLQHTGGLPDYGIHVNDEEIRYRYADPHDLLDVAFQHPADAPPGTSWGYSNTNYILAGLLVQKVTGRPLAEEMNRRIFAPIGLRDTYFPSPGDMTIRGPHPKGYHRTAPDSPLSDVTEMDPSWGWAAGQLISTTSDLNQFLYALLDGRLLPAAELDQMRTTVHVGGPTGLEYGLGLTSRTLSCGGVYWGHGGDIVGYETRGGITDNGRAVNLAVTALPTTASATQHVVDTVDRALCS
ncbi:serine hydrolase domain-containing protein [Rhodococcus qingshengii]|uniref:serine hydrolase domain-containing protein n=1 Tax=Rhodococcus qingshengii TaxID=334542 RepID=UPI0024BA8807|nr:serine hydrolase domain-containing protein [Rhodococcus qingshengii]MDJ0437967.1 serine hydrolase domain-containing protein [Rhodococcus qingshengii]